MSSNGNSDGREAVFLDAARWVATQLGRDTDEPDWESAPSDAARGLMHWVRENSKNEGTFWTRCFTKLLPTEDSEADESCNRFAALYAPNNN